MKHCPACNAMLPDSSEQCNFCWEKLDPECYGVPIEEKPVRIPKKVILLFALLAAAGIFWWKCQRLPPGTEVVSTAHAHFQDLAVPAP